MYRAVILCAFIISVNGTVLSQEEISKNCHRSDPNINFCLQRRAKEILPALCKGNKKLNIPAFSPLRVPAWAFFYDEEFRMNATLKGIQILGHKMMKINIFTFEPRTLKGEVQIEIPSMKIKIDSQQSEGHVFQFPVSVDAYHNWEFDNVELDFTYQLETVTRSGKEYFILKDLKTIRRFVEKGTLEMRAADPKAQASHNAQANMFSTNTRLMMDYFNNYHGMYIARLYQNYFNSVLKRIPADELLPK